MEEKAASAQARSPRGGCTGPGEEKAESGGREAACARQRALGSSSVSAWRRGRSPVGSAARARLGFVQWAGGAEERTGNLSTRPLSTVRAGETRRTRGGEEEKGKGKGKGRCLEASSLLSDP